MFMTDINVIASLCAFNLLINVLIFAAVTHLVTDLVCLHQPENPTGKA